MTHFSSLTAAVRLALFSLTLLVALAAPAVAATSTWTAAGGTSNFSDAGNWDAFPTPNCIMVFPAGTPYSLKGKPFNDLIGLTIDQLNIYESYTISGNAITCKNINDYNAATANVTLPINTAGSAVLTITVTTATGTLNLTGILSGAGPVTYGGPGIKRLNGTKNNTLSGLSIVALGTLVLDSSAAESIAGPLTINIPGTVLLKSAPEIKNTVIVTVNGTFDLSAATGNDGVDTEIIGGLAGTATAGVVALGSKTLGCSGQVAPTVFAGGFSGTGAFRQSGSGTEVLSGTSFPYTGATKVAGGAIHVWGQLLNSPFTVTSGTLVLANDCSVGTVNLAGATSVLSFDETISAMTMHGTTPSLTLGSGATFMVLPKSPTDYSTVSTASANISGSVLVVDTSLFSPDPASVMTIISNTGAAPVSGTFSGLSEGALVTSATNSATTFTISYVGGSGNDVTLTGFAKASDTTPPAITSGPAAGSLTGNSAVITWTTDELSTSQVEFGTSTTYGRTTSLNASLVTSHSVPVTGLTGSTLYHYRVLSKDAAGNLVRSTDATFTTLADITPPVISSIAADSISDHSFTANWSTDEVSDSQVEYGLTTTYGTSTTLDGSQVTAHSVPVTGLSANTTYHYRVLSTDGTGNLTTSGDQTVTTGSPSDSSDDDRRCGSGNLFGLMVTGLLLGFQFLTIRRGKRN